MAALGIEKTIRWYVNSLKDITDSSRINQGLFLSNPWLSANLSNEWLPAPLFMMALAAAKSGGSGSTTTVTKTLPATLAGNSNFKFNLVWDSTVQSSSFQTSIQNAAATIANVLSDKLTINVGISNTGTGGGAGAGPSTGVYETYGWTYSHLKNSDPTFNTLANTTSVQGQTNVAVWNAQLKLWGLTPTGALDGSATFATDISSGALFGVALHELTHALGRIPYGSAPDVFDLFRFTTPGTMLFSSAIPAPLAYFSIDGGVTNLAYFGMSSDPSDFYNGTPTGKMHSVYNTTNDAFSEYYGSTTYQYLTAVDLHSMVALGFHINPLSIVNSSATFTTTPVIVLDTASQIQANLDKLNTNINSIYSISQSDTAPMNVTATQSVNDSSVLQLLNLYEKLNVNVTGTSGNDTIYGIGNAIVKGNGGIDTISLLNHTATTVDKIYHNSAVSLSNLDKVSGFLSGDNIFLANSASSLNGLTNLGTGAIFAAGSAVLTNILQVTAGKAFTVSISGIDVIDVIGTTFTSVAALISNLASNASGSTYATFSNPVSAGSHFLVEYTATDGTHIALITQGTSSTHLASNSTGVDLIDLVGVNSHVTASHFSILTA
jgi:hypothetical protein